MEDWAICQISSHFWWSRFFAGPAMNAVIQQSSRIIVGNPLMMLMHNSGGHLVLMACCSLNSCFKSEISQFKIQSYNKMNLLCWSSNEGTWVCLCCSLFWSMWTSKAFQFSIKCLLKQPVQSNLSDFVALWADILLLVPSQCCGTKNFWPPFHQLCKNKWNKPWHAWSMPTMNLWWSNERLQKSTSFLILR